MRPAAYEGPCLQCSQKTAWSRGLCRTCWRTAKASGLLNTTALPSQNPRAGRPRKDDCQLTLFKGL
jgi:hypothetical protein